MRIIAPEEDLAMLEMIDACSKRRTSVYSFDLFLWPD